MTSNSVFDDLLGSTQTQFKFFPTLDLDLSDHIKFKPRRNDVAWVNDITEIIGSESGDHFTAEEPGSLSPLHYSNAAGKSRSSYSASTTRKVVISGGREFRPEYMSTLNRDGRPRFVLKKLRISTGESFRLLITMEESDQRFFCNSDVSMIKKTKKKKIESLNCT